MHAVRIVLQRIAYSAGLLLAVVVLNFSLLHLAPGDPADTIAGEAGGANKEMLAAIRAQYGLDKPFLQQLWIYVRHVLHGDLGHSYYFNQPVTQLILGRLGATLLLVLTSLTLAFLLGTFLGVVAARRPRGLLSHAITFLSLVGYALPVFWTGIMLVILFASWVPIFPVSGMAGVRASSGGLGHALDVAYHLVLPVVTLSTIYLAVYSRLSRASMLEVLGADYIRTARAKGLAEGLVIYKHALRNAILPAVTYIGLQFSQVISGAVLVETVFSWPGLGTLAFDSILRRDAPTVLGILFVSAVVVVAANLLTDMVTRLIDPRIRSGSAA